MEVNGAEVVEVVPVKVVEVVPEVVPDVRALEALRKWCQTSALWKP